MSVKQQWCAECNGWFDHGTWQHSETASSFAAPSGSPAPNWYSAEELRHYLRRERYSDEIADELSAQYAANLQRAFNKGYEIASRKTKLANVPDQRPGRQPKA